MQALLPPARDLVLEDLRVPRWVIIDGVVRASHLVRNQNPTGFESTQLIPSLGRPISNARPVTHGGPNVARPGNGASHGLMTNWTVGATTAQPAFKPASGGRSRSRSPTRSTFTPTKIRPYTVGRAPAPAPPSPPKIRESVLV